MRNDDATAKPAMTWRGWIGREPSFGPINHQRLKETGAMRPSPMGRGVLGLLAGLTMSVSPLVVQAARAGATPRHGGDLVMLRAAQLRTLMPSQPTDNASIWVIEEVYDTLLLPKADGKGVGPDLATSWSQSANGLDWTFKLRHGVTFTNGQPLTSKDVKFSIEQTEKPSSPFSFIDASIAKITTPDKYTVVIQTTKPSAPLPADMAIFANSIVPYDYAGMKPADFAKHPIGTGPFMLKSLTPGVEATFVRNPHYWRHGLPYLNSITFKDVADSNTRVNEVQGGEAQIDEFPAYSSILTLQNSGTVKIGAFPSSRVDFLAINNTKTPFNNVDVRRAIASAIDKKTLVKVVLFGHGTPAGAYMSPSSWSFDKSIKGYPYDMKAAKAYLQKSPVPHGFSGTITVASGNSDQQTMAQIIQASLAKLGIKITIQTLDPAAVYDARQNGNFDLAFGYDTTDIVDPDEIIRFVGAYDGGAHALYSFYKNKKIDGWIAKAATLNTQAARQTLYFKVEQQWNRDQPDVPLYYTPEVYAYAANVHGFHPFVTGNYNLVDVWMSK
jgi:peptide/nickel transport system substrate-binding protein